MAVTENLVYNIAINTDTQSIDKIKGQLEGLGATVKEDDQSFFNLNKRFTGIADGVTSIAIANKVFDDGTKQISAQMSDLTKLTAGLTAQFEKMIYAIRINTEAIIMMMNNSEDMAVTYQDVAKSAIATDDAMKQLSATEKTVVESEAAYLDQTVKNHESLFDRMKNLSQIAVDNWGKVIVEIVAAFQGFKIFEQPIQAIFQNLQKTGALSKELAINISLFMDNLTASFKSFLNTNAVPWLDFFDKQLPKSLVTTVNMITKLLPLAFVAGWAMKDSENSYRKFFGNVLFWGSAMIAGLSTIIPIAMQKIGQGISDVGQKLLFVSDSAGKAFDSLKSSTQYFTDTLEKANKEQGSMLLGSTQQWEKFVDSLATSTKFTREEIIRSSASVLTTTKGLGLGFTQMTDLVERGADIASQSQKGLIETTDDLMGTLKSREVSVQTSDNLFEKYGVTLDETTLKENEFGKTLGMTTVQMTDNQLSLLKLNQIYDDTQNSVSAATMEMETYAGAHAKLSKIWDMIIMKLSENSEIWKKFQEKLDAVKKGIEIVVAAMVSAIPEALILGFVALITTVKDFIAIIIILTGEMIKWSGIIVGIYLSLKTLSVILGFVSGSVVTVTGLFMGLMTTVLPLIIALSTLIIAWKTLSENSDVFSRILGKLVPNMGKVGDKAKEQTSTFEELRKALEWLFKVMKDFAGFLISSVFQAISAVQLAWLKLKTLWSDTKTTEDLNKQISQTRMELVEVNKLAAETGGAFLNDFVPGANAASTSTAILSNSLDDYITTNKKALFTMDEFKKSVFEIAAKTKDGFKEGNLRIHIMGNEFEKANLRIIEARKSIDDIWKAGKGKEETAKMFNEASQSLVSAQIEVEKLRQDTVEGIKQKYTELYIQRLKEAGAGVTALEEEQSLRMSLIKKELDGLKSLGSLTGEQQNQIAHYIKLLEKMNKLEIGKEKAKQEKIIEGIRQKTLEYELEIGDSGNWQIMNAQKILKSRQDEIKAAEEQMSYVEGRFKAEEEGAKARAMAEGAYYSEIQKMVDDIGRENLAWADELYSRDLDQYGLIKKELMDREKLIDQRIKTIQLTQNIGAAEDELIAKLETQREIVRNMAKAKVLDVDISKLDEFGKKVYDIMKTSGDFFAESVNPVIQEGVSLLNEGLQGLGMDAEGSMANILDAISSFEIDPETIKKISYGIARGFEIGGNMASNIISGIASFFNPDNINKIADTLSYLLEQLPDLLVKAFGSLSKILDKFISSFPSIVTKLMDALPGIVDGIMKKLPDLIAALMDGLTKFLDKLPDITDKIFKALPSILESFMKKLPEVITALFKAIPKIISQILKVIPELIVTFLNNLPDIIETLIVSITGAIDDIIISIIDFVIGGGLAKIIESIVKAIPKIIMSIITGTLKSMQNTFNKLFRGVNTDTFKEDILALPGKIEEKMKKLSKTVAKESSQIFKVLDMQEEAKAVDRAAKAKSVVDVIQAATDMTNKKTKNLFEKYWDGMTNMWRWFYDNFVEYIVKGLTEVWRWVYDKILEPIIGLFREMWLWLYEKIFQPIINAFTELWRFVWDKIFKPILDGLKAVWDWVMNYIVKPIFEGIKKDWMTLINNLQNAWKYATDLFNKAISWLKDIFDYAVYWLQSIWTIIWTTILEPFINMLKSVWDGIIAVLQPVIDAFIKAWNTVIEGLSSWLTSLTEKWDAMMKSLSDGWKTITDFFNTIGDLLSNAVKGLNFGDAAEKFGKKISETFSKGISGVADDFIKYLSEKIGSIGNLAAKMFSFDGGGRGTVEKALGIDVPFTAFAWGGTVGQVLGRAKVPGNSPLNDIVPAWLSPGEFVLPRSVMDIPGVSQIVDTLMSGDISNLWKLVEKGLFANLMNMFKMPEGFAMGGPVNGMMSLRKGQIGGMLPGSNEMNTYNIGLTLNIETKDSSLDATYIRTKLMPTLKDELKKASMKGEFILADRGIRTI